MSELGQLLKKARLESGLSLDDLQETTKIQKRYLEAIEEGNYKILPGSFYVRAFIKSYAEAVGLEPNEVLRLYRNVIPSPQAEQTVDPIRTKRANTRNTERMNKWISGIMMWSFVILIAGIIYYYISSTHKGGSGDVLDNQDQRVTDKAEPIASETDTGSPSLALDNKPEVQPPPVEPPKPKPDVKLSKSEGGVDFYDVTNVAKLTLEIKVTGGDCWIRVDEIVDDNKKVRKEEGTLVNGDTRSWELEHSAYVTLGKANAVEFKANGVSIPVGDLPNPKRFQFNLQKS